MKSLRGFVLYGANSFVSGDKNVSVSHKIVAECFRYGYDDNYEHVFVMRQKRMKKYGSYHPVKGGAII